MIKAVGNYGEIFDRNLGVNASISLARGTNRQWTDGGLICSPPSADDATGHPLVAQPPPDPVAGAGRRRAAGAGAGGLPGGNLVRNLAAAGLLLTWQIGNPAGFDVAGSWLPFSAEQPYWWALLAVSSTPCGLSSSA